MASAMSDFERLVADLQATVFTSDGVMLKNGVIDAMKRYVSEIRDWKPYIHVMPEAHQAYTRNLIDACDDKHNLVGGAAVGDDGLRRRLIRPVDSAHHADCLMI